MQSANHLFAKPPKLTASRPPQYSGRSGGRWMRREQRLRDGLRPRVPPAERQRGRNGDRLQVSPGDLSLLRVGYKY